MSIEELNEYDTLEDMLGKKGEFIIFQYEQQLVEFLESEFVVV